MGFQSFLSALDCGHDAIGCWWSCLDFPAVGVMPLAAGGPALISSLSWGITACNYSFYAAIFWEELSNCNSNLKLGWA